MRVLMTTDTIGGVWTFTRQLATDLLRCGHQVGLVSFGAMPSISQREWCDSSSAAWSRDFLYVPSAAPLEWMQNNAGAYTEALPVLLSIIRDFRPDVILSSQYCFGRLPVSIPKVVVAHSDVLSWAQACGKAPLPGSEWLVNYVQLVSDGLVDADAVVGPTKWMLTALEKNFSLPCDSVVIWNGRTLDPSPKAIVKKMQAVTAGRFWDEAKHLSILAGLDSSVPILVAGTPACDCAPATLSSACLTLLGELPNAEVLSVFRESSIYICSSIYEPFGLAPLEAALCGCAVVANDLPSLREVWGDCALFFNDRASLQQTLRSLTDDRMLAAAQTRSGERASLFTSSRMTERYVHLFERLLRSRTTNRKLNAA